MQSFNSCVFDGWGWVFTPLLGFSVYVISILARARMQRGIVRLNKHFSSFIGGVFCLASAFILFFRIDPNISHWNALGWAVFDLLVYANLCFCFFNFYNSNIGSLRVVLLKVFLLHDPNPIDASTLYRYHSAHRVLQTRVEQLEKSGQIVKRGGRFFLQKRSLIWIGRFFYFMTRLIFARDPK